MPEHWLETIQCILDTDLRRYDEGGPKWLAYWIARSCRAMTDGDGSTWQITVSQYRCILHLLIRD